jgi:DNA-binding response OmpR family regulator
MTGSPPPVTAAQLSHARHELRTPVNAIIGYSEMLLEDLDAAADPQSASALERLQNLGKRLQALIAEQLDESRLSAGNVHIGEILAQDVRRVLLPPAQQVGEACESIAARAAAASVAPLMADVKKIAAAGRMLQEMLDDPLRLGPVPVSTAAAPPPPQSDASTADESMPTSEEDFKAGRAGHILVVDDNQFNREMLARGLHRQNHYFALAENGRQALEMLDTKAFDLVLLDILMPEMDGFEVLRRLKSDERLKHVPVIMISALDQIEGVVRCIEMGAEDYLPKPFNPVLLKARVGACLEKKRLRDLELAYLKDVAAVTQVASGVEAGKFDPEGLDAVTQRPDSLGQLARVFQSMVREVQAREERLKQEVRQLRVEIDEGRKARQVAEITETDYFQQLKVRAQELKARKRPDNE